jgi:hypothetical protein
MLSVFLLLIFLPLRELTMSTAIRSLVLVLYCFQAGLFADDLVGEPWARHTIDDSSRGADGVRVDDINRDGLPDLCTGWEEGGVIRVYLNPGPESAHERWPAVTVGRVASPEDAVFADVDRDGVLDVVSSCEGRTRTMFVHWAPGRGDLLLDADAWRTAEIPVTARAQSWMFCLPLAMEDAEHVELFAGAKGGGAQIVHLVRPERPRELTAWRMERLYEAGWIMSLIAEDMDGDGDADILFSDRKGPTRGCKWLENAGADSEWTVHLIGGGDHEVMFLARGDVNDDGLGDVVAATRDEGLLVLRRESNSGNDWTTESIPMPADTGTGKGVAVSDVDGDGRSDLVVSCENANDRTGVFWLRQHDSSGARWIPQEISGTATGTKFDRLELIDLDADGDEDVITCEERDNLGVIWYENPQQ